MRIDNNRYGYSSRRRRIREPQRSSMLPKLLGVLAVLIMMGLSAAWGMGLFDSAPAAPQQEVESEVDKAPVPSQEQTVAKQADEQPADFGSRAYRIHIHKLSYKLELFEKGKSGPIRTYDVAVAKNTGDKKRSGDNTTPTSWGDVEASIPGAVATTDSRKVPFVVEDIYYAGDWSHDFGDGKGEIPGAYGPWFISLNTGWNGIGIHGTHDPDSIGHNVSEGCIRLHNQDIKELKEIISQDNDGVGVKVIISED